MADVLERAVFKKLRLRADQTTLFDGYGGCVVDLLCCEYHNNVFCENCLLDLC